MTEDQVRDMFAPQPLANGLAPYLRNGALGQVFHHPLCIQPMYVPQLNKQINLQIAQKRAAIDAAKTKCDYERILVLHERPYRTDVLLKYAPRMSDTQYWETLGWVWRDTENVHECLRQWLTLWSARKRPGREQCMLAGERAYLASLPAMLQVHRGTMHKESIHSFAWTLDPAKAAWFAKRFRTDGAQAYVATANVRRSDVWAYFDARNEDEIVVHPRHLQNLDIKEI